MDRVTLDRNKRKLEKALKVQQRRHNEKQRKMNSESSFFVEQSQGIEAVYQALLMKKILTLACLKILNKASKFIKSNLLLISILIPLSGVKPTVWW